MTISHIFEDFSTPEPEITSDSEAEDQGDQYEEMRLAEFERGYSAGWEDAEKAQRQDQMRITGALAQSLEDLGFTFHEAVAHMTSALEPVFRALADTVLPDALNETLGVHILSQLRDMAETQMTGPIQVVVPPGRSGALEPILSGEFSIPVELIEDPAMGEGGAAIRIGHIERDIDTTALTATIRDAVEAFFHQATEESRHG